MNALYGINGAEEVLMAGEIIKKNKFGMNQKRDFVLTSTPRLFFVDMDGKEVKGDLEFSYDGDRVVPRAEIVSALIFICFCKNMSENLYLRCFIQATSTSFVLYSNVKDGKEYKLAIGDSVDRFGGTMTSAELWVKVINAVPSIFVVRR